MRPAAVLAAGAACLVLCPALDLLWTVAFASPYRRAGEFRLIDGPSIPSVAMFYCLFAIGLVAFAVTPALHVGRWLPAAVDGALFGAVANILYALAARILLRGRSGIVPWSAITWSTAAAAVTAVAGYLCATALD